ncbi:MAG: glycosyltransferase family 1 protein, partial [Janthinobacterium sp.]
QRLLADRPLRLRLAAAGRATVEQRFDTELMLEKLATLYARLDGAAQ